jgi:DnaJ-class molecular chaperone
MRTAAGSEEDQVQADGSIVAETSEFHTACAVLGLSTTPSASEARTAFRARAALLHPDVHQSAGADRMNAATAAMQQLNDAYQLVLEALVAGDPHPANVTRGRGGTRRRCTRCRTEFRGTADDARDACPKCGRGLAVRSRRPRSYSATSASAGRVVIYSKRRRTQPPAEPHGRLAHLTLWHGDG